jgi:DNA polymerase
MHGFFSSSAVQKDKPQSLIARCGACGLYKTCIAPKMRPFGRGKKSVLVVGEAPDRNEDERGRPFVGEAGDKLRSILRSVGVDLDRDALTTNALICRPPKNATPKPQQIDYCRPNLLKTIEQFQPNVIVTLGRSALASVMQSYWRSIESLERWVGWQIPIERHWICPTWHPSYLNRVKNSLMDRKFQEHLQKAFAIDTAPPSQPDYAKKIEVLLDDRHAEEALGRIDSEGGWVAVDYETNCLKPEYEESKCYSCAVSNGRRTISYPWYGRAIPATGRFLASRMTRKIASNMKMEERWTRKLFGFGVANWAWDTMLAAHSLDNRTGICSIKFQALIRLGVPEYNQDIEPYLKSSKGHYNRIHEIDLKRLLLYGGFDGILEHKVAAHQRKEMGL